MNLFAIIEDQNLQAVSRIPLSQGLQDEVGDIFTDLANSFFEDKNFIPFDGNYNTGQDELFEIPNYPLSQDILNSGINALNYEILDIEEVEGRVKAIYASIPDGRNGNQFCFQYFDSRKIIANRGVNLFLDGETYSRYEKRGIVITNDVTAMYRNNNLYFSSYFNTRKFLDLIDYYQEATDQDVNEFADTGIFIFEDPAGFRENLNSILRKKIKSIQQRGVLVNVPVNDISNQARQFGIEVQIENDRMSIPNDKDFVNRLIKFLDEDYFVTPLTHRKCVTNSKREIGS